jgi:alanine-glyoxylate transaminase/serine-glyoxylate transaminase/serine-pyruvate transaminase
MREIDVKPLSIEEECANTLTVALYPNSVDDAKFRMHLGKKHGVVIAGGLGELAGKSFRVGHMGNVNPNDIMSVISAIEAALAEQVPQYEPGRGIAAAIKRFST